MVRRFSNSVHGATSGTEAVAEHTVFVPHADRLRPSDLLISEVGAFQSALYGIPDTFCKTPLKAKPPGSG